MRDMGFYELDDREQFVLELVERVAEPDMNFRAYVPDRNADGDIHIILWDSSEESLFKIPDVLFKMAADKDIPDFSLKRAFDVMDHVEECNNGR